MERARFFWLFITVMVTLTSMSNAASPYAEAHRDYNEYLLYRQKMITEERSRSLGGQEVLDSNEQELSDYLMKLKIKEIDKGFNDVSTYNPAQHFFKRKPYIEESPVFKFIRRMPKGAALHVHDTALIGEEFLVKNISYMNDLYICIVNDGIKLHFYKTPPPPTRECVWELVKNVRESYQDPEEFDNELGKYFTLVVDNPIEVYPNIDVVWKAFNKIFETITPMLTYKPAWETYMYEALRQFAADNVFYIEMRSTLPNIYDLDGNIYGPIDCAAIIKNVSDRYKKDNPGSFGIRIIYGPNRLVEEDKIKQYVQTALDIRKKLGNFIVGFDLVGQEDKGKPLEAFLKELINVPTDLNVFYHAGETNWYGTSSDYNLIDAVLLGAKRLGHAYGLLKHPVAADLVKKMSIAVEVNPLSNQILMLVADFRNHPASLLLANNFPMVISSDDPGLWGGLPMSHDLYMAFIGLASREDDLRTLKRFVFDTIRYSSIPESEKPMAMETLTAQWKDFVKKELELIKAHKKDTCKAKY